MRSRARRFASALVAAIALGVAGSGAAATHAVPAPPTGATLAALAAPPVYGPLASQRIYFVMPDRYANGDPANDLGGLCRHARRHRLRPGRDRLLPRRRPEGADGRLRRPGTGSARIRDLGFTAVWVTPPVKQKPVHRGLGRLPRLLDPRLHDRRPAPRHRGRLRRARRLRPPARAEGLPRRRRQPHRRRDPPAGRLVLGRDDPVPRLQRARRSIPARYAGGRTFPCLNLRSFPRTPSLFPGDRAAEEAGLAQRRHRATTTAATSTSPRAPSSASSRATSSGSTTSSPSSRRCVSGLAELCGLVDRDATRSTASGSTRRGTSTAAFFRRLGAADPGRRARRRRAGLPALRRGLHHATRSTSSRSSATAGSRTSSTSRCRRRSPRFAGGDAGARGIATRLGDDDYFRARRRASRRAADVPRQPRHGPRRAEDPGALARERRRAAAARAARPRPALPPARRADRLYGDEVGIVGRGGDQQARQDLFPTQVDEWRTQERVGSAPDRRRARRSTSAEPSRGAAAAARSRRCARRTRRSRRAGRPCGSRRGASSSSAASTPRRGASTWRRSTAVRARRASPSRPRRPGRRGRRSSARRHGDGLADADDPAALEPAPARRRGAACAPARAADAPRRGRRPHRVLAAVGDERRRRVSVTFARQAARRAAGGASPPTTRRRTARSSTRRATAATSPSTSSRSRAGGTGARPHPGSCPSPSGDGRGRSQERGRGRT